MDAKVYIAQKYYAENVSPTVRAEYLWEDGYINENYIDRMADILFYSEETWEAKLTTNVLEGYIKHSLEYYDENH